MCLQLNKTVFLGLKLKSFPKVSSLANPTPQGDFRSQSTRNSSEQALCYGFRQFIVLPPPNICEYVNYPVCQPQKVKPQRRGGINSFSAESGSILL